ncbi:MAG: hypothetical protein JXA66_00195 [Oligoflexia bacterium]|nr:hypothetical protein [Oligoflexia bacterium]
MLTELAYIMIPVSMIVLFCGKIHIQISRREEINVKMHRAVYNVFFSDECKEGVTCADSEISTENGYKISIRRPKKPYGNKREQEKHNGKFEKVFEELEAAASDGTHK